MLEEAIINMARKRERMKREKAISDSCTFDAVLYALITLSDI
jgi:hypothetical protein